MESDGQKGFANPSAMLKSLFTKHRRLQVDLRNIEKQVYELETSYLKDSSHKGSVLKGFDGYLSWTKTMTNLKRSRKVRLEDRLFSLSSVTSPAAKELGLQRDEGITEVGPVWFKGEGLSASGLGNPKKGRATRREGKRIKSSGEPDFS